MKSATKKNTIKIPTMRIATLLLSVVSVWISMMISQALLVRRPIRLTHAFSRHHSLRMSSDANDGADTNDAAQQKKSFTISVSYPKAPHEPPSTSCKFPEGIPLENAGQLTDAKPQVFDGVDIDTLNLVTSAIVGAGFGNMDIARHLAQHDCDMDLTGVDGQALLMGAVMYNNFGMVQYLVQNGADIHKPWIEGMTPLMIAVLKNRVDVDLLEFDPQLLRQLLSV